MWLCCRESRPSFARDLCEPHIKEPQMRVCMTLINQDLIVDKCGVMAIGNHIGCFAKLNHVHICG